MTSCSTSIWDGFRFAAGIALFLVSTGAAIAVAGMVVVLVDQYRKSVADRNGRPQ